MQRPVATLALRRLRCSNSNYSSSSSLSEGFQQQR
jgi:hypothetical protein